MHKIYGGKNLIQSEHMQLFRWKWRHSLREKHLFLPFQKLRGQNLIFSHSFARSTPSVAERKERLKKKCISIKQSLWFPSIDFVPVQKTSISCSINVNNVLRCTMFSIYDIQSSHSPRYVQQPHAYRMYIGNVIIREASIQSRLTYCGLVSAKLNNFNCARNGISHFACWRCVRQFLLLTLS